MKTSNKVIITCAVTGSIHTPSMSRYLPVTPDEIADSAIEAANAGASIVHLHVRDPMTGKPTQDAELFKKVLAKIKGSSDVIANITTGGSPVMTVEERMQPVLKLKPELASLNMGSMNFGLFPMLQKYQDFQHEWEEPYLAGSTDLVFKNTFKDIEYILTQCEQNQTRFEVECYDISHLYTAAHFLNRGLLKPPIFIQSVFGILGGIGQDPEDILHMKRTADRLFGDDYVWSVLGAGAKQMRINTLSASMGGNCRVGLEDNLWEEPGKIAVSNASQVRRIKSIIEALSLDVASPEQARNILSLKGLDNVGY